MILDEVKIIYEDENIVAINKPSGFVVHYDGKTDEPNLCDWILKKYPQIENIGESLKLNDGKEIKRPGIVHRIDRETSGVLLIVKNQKTFLNLKNQFKNREIKKIYNAFVYGEIKENHGIINKPIGKSRKDFRQRSASDKARGELRDAITEYKVLKKNSSTKLGAGKDFSFVEISPKTGRTHQIRVHFKLINHPIVCDKLYSGKRECALGFERLALHAFSVEFKNTNGIILRIEAPLPNDFKRALAFLK